MANQNLSQLDDTRAAGFNLVLNLNNAPKTAQPAVPPAEINGYKNAVASALDRYKPALAVIENEELADKFYSGTPRQYLAELNAATEVAHARNIPITNGGIVSNAVMLATWNDLWTSGKRKEADTYAARAFDKGRLAKGTINDLPSSANPTKPVLAKSERLRRLLREAQQLITGYRKSKIDYVNFHWYGAGSNEIKQSIDYLERATKKPAVTNEIGQFNQDPSTVTSLLKATTSKKLPFVVWYGGDTGGAAVGLFEPKGGKLRANGNAFRDFMFANTQFSG